MKSFTLLLLACSLVASWCQEYGQPDRDEPGDAMIQAYLKAEAEKLEKNFLPGIETAEDWGKVRPRLIQEYYEMLGLWPLPDRTDLKATIIRTLDRGDYFVDMIHFQSRPGLYVTGNIYRPVETEAGVKRPAVLYLCGHSQRGRNGNKTAYQSHGIWLARHGYVCLMLDTLQLGEIAGIHHGTYREERWWWVSRGYTPAGVEAWNGVRAIDYLQTRRDVDPDRIAVTGISGGGSATFWITAADERVKIAAPVSGMADLVSYIPSRMINGHCDCMFLYNAYQWHWTTIPSLIAPRPMLFVNSDDDVIFPMDANERIINRLERLYSLFGASDDVDAFVSIGGHAYRQDIRQGTFRFFNTHFKNDHRPVTDSEMDLVDKTEQVHPIPPEELRVFPEDKDFPLDARNGHIDQEFVPMADPGVPSKENLGNWRETLINKLRRLTFHHFPERIPPGEMVDGGEPGKISWLGTEQLIKVRLRAPGANSERLILKVSSEPLENGNDAQAYVLEPRGIGETRWTQKNPPNYVERSHQLLGRTVDSGRIWDIVAAARYLQATHPGRTLTLAGTGASGVLAIYAAILEPEITTLELTDLPDSLMAPQAPVLLNALRAGDVPHMLGMLAPRKIKVSGSKGAIESAKEIYRAAGAEGNLTTFESARRSAN